jgi:hypothetical protein
MLAFKIEIDGEFTLIAGVPDWSILALHITASRGDASAPAESAKQDSTRYSVGGFSTPDQTDICHHFRWQERELAVGSMVHVEVIETDAPDPVIKRYRSDAHVQENPFTDAEMRALRFQDYMELKKEFEGATSGTTSESRPLNMVSLRLSGDDAALDEIVHKLNLAVTTRFKAGDLRGGGGTRVTSGLNASIADEVNPSDMLARIRTFVSECLQRGPTLFANGVSAELSIGTTVGDSSQYLASLDFSPSEIHDLAVLGISLNFTAYPTSDHTAD